MPDPEKQFYLDTDASDVATGATLLQENPEGDLQPVAFFSKKMVAAERNYDIFDKELLAII